MAFCENENCRKAGLRKEDVERDVDRHMILCHGCYALVHPGWMPPQEVVILPEVLPSHGVPRVSYEVSISNDAGVRAQVSYGAISLTLRAPQKSLRGLLENLF